MQLIKITAMKQPQVGKLIRSLRHELELTQQQLSVELGTVTSTVNRWENGHSQPSPMALKLVEAKLTELGERGKDLLEQFSANPSSQKLQTLSYPD